MGKKKKLIAELKEQIEVEKEIAEAAIHLSQIYSDRLKEKTRELGEIEKINNDLISAAMVFFESIEVESEDFFPIDIELEED